GATTGSHLIDSPFLDFDYLLKALLFNTFSTNESVTFYLIYLSTFIFSACSMYIVLRYVTDKMVIRMVVSLIFAFAPYHILRGMGHITLSNCWMVPIGIYLAYKISEIRENKAGKKELILLLLLAFISGFGNIYYGLFSFILIFVGMICNFIVNKSLNKLIEIVIVYLGIICGMAINVVPKIIFGIIAGPNSDASIRGAMESDFYGLRLAQLFLPPSYIRGSLFQKIITKYNTEYSEYVNENSLSSIGVVAIITFIVLIIVLLRLYLKNEENHFIFVSGLFLLALTVYCSVGGIGSIVASFIVSQFRGLNRVSIYFTAILLIVFAYLADKIKNKRLLAMIMIIFSVASLYENIDNPPEGFQLAQIEIDNINKEFFSEVEVALGENANVYQLPFVRFPEEPPVNNMSDYSHFKGYVYTDTINWSYGGIKGRDTYAESLYIDDGMSDEFVSSIVNVGYDAVYIDTNAYEDEGEQIVSYYMKKSDKAPIVSSDGKMYVFML
nr:hypothetical protein [Butyrivibrio sp.]